MPITSLHNGVCIPLIFSSRSCNWYVNYSDELIAMCKPVRATPPSASSDSAQRCPGTDVVLRADLHDTIRLSQQNSGSAKSFPFGQQNDSIYFPNPVLSGRKLALLACSFCFCSSVKRTPPPCVLSKCTTRIGVLIIHEYDRGRKLYTLSNHQCLSSTLSLHQHKLQSQFKAGLIQATTTSSMSQQWEETKAVARLAAP